MQNITLKPIPLIADKPLKQVPQQDYSELFSSIRNQTPYCFADINSSHLTISCLTPRITESSLRQICEEYGKVLDVRLRAFYQNFKASIVAHITYETAQEAKFAYQELQQKTEAGFSFQICYGAGPLEEQDIKIKPPNNSIRAIIDKLAKFVVQEGNNFELAVKQREQNNSDFAFLFIKSEEQEYYKWKVYSLLNGDSEKHWKTDPYQISLNGRVYHPPEVDQEETQSNYAKRELERQQVQVLKEKRAQNNQPTLSPEDRLKFSNMLRELNTQRQSIGKAMVFCFDNQQCCADITIILVDSMLQESAWNHKLARLYLISDVLHNSGSHGFAYKQYFQWYLADVFSNLKELLPYKEKVMKVLGVWREWNVYESKYLKGLEMTFLEPPQMVDCAAAKLYQEKLMRADDPTIQRISRSRGLPQGERQTMIFRIVQLKFYNRKIVDITQDQVLLEKDSQLNKYLNIYRHIVDKDQQSIIDSQKQSFVTQIQLMQEFQKFLQKRYKNIINDADGEQMDWIDEKVFEIQKHNEYQRVEKNYYQNIDGKELTDEDMKLIEDKKVQVILNYDISYIYPKPPIPPPPTEQIEIELQKYREKLQSSGVHSPIRIEEFIKAKRNLIHRVEFMRKEKEQLAQQQIHQQQQQQQQQQQSSGQQPQQQSQGKSKKQKKASSSSDSGTMNLILDHKHKKSKHYRKRSRSDSRKKHSYKKNR